VGFSPAFLDCIDHIVPESRGVQALPQTLGFVLGLAQCRP
jgi:hypothetical protein